MPLDYDDPDGPQPRIALARFRAIDPARRIGTLFLNRGGPGGSGVDLRFGYGDYMAERLKGRIDIAVEVRRLLGDYRRREWLRNFDARYLGGSLLWLKRSLSPRATTPVTPLTMRRRHCTPIDSHIVLPEQLATSANFRSASATGVPSSYVS